MLKAVMNGYRKIFAAMMAVLMLAGLGIETRAADAIADFNGDGKTDFAVMRPVQTLIGSQYTWYIRHNGEENITAVPFGLFGVDAPQPMDFDGDGKDDIAMWRARLNTTNPNDRFGFYIINSSDSTLRFIQLGKANDMAVSADYDGDGKDDPAIYSRPLPTSPGPAYWCYVGSLNNPTGQATCVNWGERYNTGFNDVDEPYPGDFDGDGKADFAVQAPLNRGADQLNGQAAFRIKLSTGQILPNDYWSLRDDRVVPGDYNGDGKTDLAVARGFNIGSNPPTPIEWFIRYRSGQADDYISFGTGSNFNFVQGDYDGDGADDVALFVPSDGTFYYRPSSAPNTLGYYQWGTFGDRPAAGYNNR